MKLTLLNQRDTTGFLALSASVRRMKLRRIGNKWQYMPGLCFLWTGIAALLLLTPPNSQALIPEPHNILYGTITLDGVPVTAMMSNVVVEARRATNGPVVASYRMGSNPQVANFYSLRLPVESINPIGNEDHSVRGDNLIIFLRDPSGIRAQTNFTIVERGEVLRADFGMAVFDSDIDKLPDTWEIRNFGSLANGPGTLSGNGQPVIQHYIAGTDPNDPNGGFRLHINLTNDLKRVWFFAALADQPDYPGMTRLYTLEYRPNAESGFWTDVPQVTGVAGMNQLVNYFTPGFGPPGFYRVRIFLAGYNLPSGDSDSDGLPDDWEILNFGSLDRSGSYVALNVHTALQNYTAGTDPNDPGSALKLTIHHTSGQQHVSWLARKAQGTGYDGKNRFYSLESSTNPAGVYITLPGYSNLLGGDSLITYPVPVSEPQRFFRARVSLVNQ
jgi:hypothetical protein